jgi:hypothetical protein
MLHFAHIILLSRRYEISPRVRQKANTEFAVFLPIILLPFSWFREEGKNITGKSTAIFRDGV